MDTTAPARPPLVPPAQSRSDLIARFGDLVVEGEQIIAPRHWESQNMVRVPELPGWPRRVYCNRAIVEPLRLALTAALAACPGYAVRTLGCFAPRMKRSGSGNLSLHSWGLAVDINASTNPMRRPLETDMPAEWIASWEGVGWTWGGHWRTPDPMHFQWCDGY